MSWEREYERYRDYGKTWGPGIDDAREPSEEELAAHNAKMEAYRQKLRDASVPAREVFMKAGEALRAVVPSSADVLEGRAPANWQAQMSKTKMELCKKACESLGYSFDYPEKTYGIREYREAHGRNDGTFAISVEHMGWMPNRGGNLHQCFVCGVRSLEDCLQLVADFSAIGLTPTTWYGKDFHYSCGHTGELRLELERRFGAEEFAKTVNSLLADTVKRAAEQSVNVKEKTGPDKSL